MLFPPQRLVDAQAATMAAGLDALLISPGADLRYLTGYHAHQLERLTLLVLPADGEPTLVVPRLERPAAEASPAPGTGVRIVAAMGEWLRAGRTEAEVATDIATAVRAAGHATVEFTIVAAGPNGASPHHSVSDRVIRAGEPVVVDIGGAMPDGYCSDSTRVYVVGDPPDGFLDAYQVLWRAQRTAVAAVRPGVSAASVDAAARDVLVEAGYGEQFTHRTGHGIGLDCHEAPYLVAGNDLPLAPGMTFSVEPGVYVPGRYGARIEDIVACTADGVERLNTLPTELMVL